MYLLLDTAYTEYTHVWEAKTDVLGDIFLYHSLQLTLHLII